MADVARHEVVAVSWPHRRTGADVRPPPGLAHGTADGSSTARHAAALPDERTIALRGYACLSWAGLLAMGAILVWLAWVLLTNTPPGTSRELARTALGPTLAALATSEAACTEGATQAGPAAVQLPPACAACHMVAGTAASGRTGPELTHIGAIAAERIASDDYAGDAETPQQYIRESILTPDAYIVAGPGTTTGDGSSRMPAWIATALGPGEVESLSAALASLR
jgi:nitric oxide reductase subunit C